MITSSNSSKKMTLSLVHYLLDIQPTQRTSHAVIKDKTDVGNIIEFDVRYWTHAANIIPIAFGTIGSFHIVKTRWF